MPRLYVFKPRSGLFYNRKAGRTPQVGDYILTFDPDNDEKLRLYQQKRFGKACIAIKNNNLYPTDLHDDLLATQESPFALIFTHQEFQAFKAQFQSVYNDLKIPENTSPTSIFTRHTPSPQAQTNSRPIHMAESFNFSQVFESESDHSRSSSDHSEQLSESVRSESRPDTAKAEADLTDFIAARFSLDNPTIQAFFQHRKLSKSTPPVTPVSDRLNLDDLEMKSFGH